MEQKTQGGRQTLANVASVSRKAWLNILLILAALMLVALGIYMNSQPSWFSGGDVKLYNQGVVAIQQPATELLPEEGRRGEGQRDAATGGPDTTP